MAVWARPTEGAVENVQLLESGEIQIGFTTLGIAQHGWNGTADWAPGKQFRGMRAIFPMYDTPFQFVVLRDFPINSITEFAGKRIGIGQSTGTSATYVPKVLKLLKVEAQQATGTYDELAGKLKDGSLDGLAMAAGAPIPALLTLEKEAKVRYLALSHEQMVALRLSMPELGRSYVPSGTYPSLLRHYNTVGIYNFAIANPGLPDDLVSAILDAVFFKYHDEMMSAAPAAAQTLPSNFTRNTFLPFHPGAEHWYHSQATKGVVLGD